MSPHTQTPCPEKDVRYRLKVVIILDIQDGLFLKRSQITASFKLFSCSPDSKEALLPSGASNLHR